MAPARTVHLIDALPYVFRAYFSLPSSIRDASGAPANAVRGFADFLLRYLSEEDPTHAAVCFDDSLTTSFRNDLYPPYKSSRELPPPELEAQLNACQALARALGLAVLSDDRYEADDLIATLCDRARRRGHGAVVVTNDKDLGQLVDERVVLYDFAKGERHDEAGVARKLGVRPAQVPDFLGLAGDAVDDIPGVRGVGAKTAAALLEAFDDLEALYADLEGVASLPIRGAGTLGAKLEAGREDAFLSRELATVARDAPAEATLRELAWRGASKADLPPLLERLALERFADRVPRWRAR